MGPIELTHKNGKLDETKVSNEGKRPEVESFPPRTESTSAPVWWLGKEWITRDHSIAAVSDAIALHGLRFGLPPRLPAR